MPTSLPRTTRPSLLLTSGSSGWPAGARRRCRPPPRAPPCLQARAAPSRSRPRRRAAPARAARARGGAAWAGGSGAAPRRGRRRGRRTAAQRWHRSLPCASRGLSSLVGGMLSAHSKEWSVVCSVFEARGGAWASDAQPAHALTAPPRLSRMEKAAERALEARQRPVCSGLVLGLGLGVGGSPPRSSTEA